MRSTNGRTIGREARGAQHRLGNSRAGWLIGRRAAIGRPRPAVLLVFLGPTVAFFALWVFAPAIYGIYLSLTNATLLAPAQFVGLSNYQSLLTSTVWWQSIRVTISYAAQVLIPTLVLSLILARLTVRLAHGKAVLMTVFFLPYVVPAVASGVVFALLFQQYGLINQILRVSVPWLSSPSFALHAVSIATIWSLAGYYTVIFIAGYQQLPNDVLQAASLDGANDFQLFMHMELPMLRPTLLFGTVTSFAAVLSNFTSPFIMTQGGPARSTLTLPLLIYDEAFQYSSAGLGNAMAVVLLVISVIITALQLRLLRAR